MECKHGNNPIVSKWIFSSFRWTLTTQPKNIHPDKDVCFIRVDNHLDFAQSSVWLFALIVQEAGPGILKQEIQLTFSVLLLRIQNVLTTQNTENTKLN